MAAKKQAAPDEVPPPHEKELYTVQILEDDEHSSESPPNPEVAEHDQEEVKVQEKEKQVEQVEGKKRDLEDVLQALDALKDQVQTYQNETQKEDKRQKLWNIKEAKMDSEIVELKSQLKYARTETEELRQILNRKEMENSELQEKLRKFEADTMLNAIEYSKYQEEQQTKFQEVQRKLDQQITNQRKRDETFQAVLEKQKEKILKMIAEYDDQETNLQDKNIEIEVMANEIKEVRNFAKEITQQNDQLRAENESMKQEISNYEYRGTELQKVIETMDQETKLYSESLCTLYKSVCELAVCCDKNDE